MTAVTPVDVYWITPADLLVAWAAWVVVTVGAVLLTVWALRSPAPPAEADCGLPSEVDVFMSAETVELPSGRGRHRPPPRVGHAGQYRRPTKTPADKREAVR